MPKIHVVLLSVMMLLMMAIPAQAQLSNLHFGGYSITSIRPHSFSSVGGSVKVTVRNDTTAFVMQDINGKIYKLGTPMVLRCLIGFDINDYTADVSMTVIDEEGHTRIFVENDMSVAAILNNLRARKRK